jgi:hypothetical protein
MQVDRSHADGVIVQLDTSEYLALNNSLNWVCNGLNSLDGGEFDQQIGAPELQVRGLLRTVHDAWRARGRQDAVRLWLTAEQVTIAARVVDEVLHGQARMPAARGMSHDWELIGTSEAEFQRFRTDVRHLAAELESPAQSDEQ